MPKTSLFRMGAWGDLVGICAGRRVAQTQTGGATLAGVSAATEDTWSRLRPEHLSQAGPPAPAHPTCSSVRRRNSWDSSSGCSSSSESVQLRPPTSPAIVVARRPGPATHKAPRRERPGSDVKGGDSGVSSLWVRRASPLPRQPAW